MGKKVAVILCGCGSRDGSEVHESVCTLLAIVKGGAEALPYAPATPQARVVNHVTNAVEPGVERNMLVEAGRITRGNISDIKNLKGSDADALILPGGFGAAYNLFDFAEKGTACRAHPEVERVINEFYSAKKPIGFICIAPVLGARVLGRYGIEVTAGTDPATAKAIQEFGARHVNKRVDEIHVDKKNKIVSTPAYMLAKNIAEVEAGISKLVAEVLALS